MSQISVAVCSQISRLLDNFCLSFQNGYSEKLQNKISTQYSNYEKTNLVSNFDTTVERPEKSYTTE